MAGKMPLAGLQEIAPDYDHYILDIFGVIHDGLRPFPGTVRALNALKDAGKQVCLLSNSPRRVRQMESSLTAMGIERGLYNHVVTSGEATFQALQNREDEFHNSCGDVCWFIGHGPEYYGLDELGLRVVQGPEDASFILNSTPAADRETQEVLKAMLPYALERDLPMICSNPDLVVMIGNEQYECAGMLARIYEELGGRVVYHGKPHRPVYERAHRLLGAPDKSRVLAVGDAFHTDIAGAHHFGIDSTLNLVGIHWEEVRHDHQPDQADAEKLGAVLSMQDKKPTYILAGFDW